MEPRNEPVAVYCLALIAEEAGEACQAAGQALRFGLETPSGPMLDDGSAKDALEKEIGDLIGAAHFAAEHGLLDIDAIYAHSNVKLSVLCNPTFRDHLDRPLAPPLPALAR